VFLWRVFVTCAKAQFTRSGRFFSHSFCLCAELQKKTADFVGAWCYDWPYQSEERINFGNDPVPKYGLGIPDHFSTSLTIAQ